jgi:hypothetical protein
LTHYALALKLRLRGQRVRQIIEETPHDELNEDGEVNQVDENDGTDHAGGPARPATSASA